jgi:hypothetical protein
MDAQMDKISMGSPSATPVWVFGGILMIFLMGVVAWQITRKDDSKPPDPVVANVIGLLCAITAGLFAFFMTGYAFVSIAPDASRLAGLGVKAAGGAGLFVFVMWWWRSAIRARR